MQRRGRVARSEWLAERREEREEPAAPGDMAAARDRSAEFASLVRARRGPDGARGPRAGAAGPALRSHAAFMASARLVGSGIAATYSKLDKLALLAKKKSLFDDRPAEIRELTYIIKGDLGSLNQQIARLGEMPRGQRHIQSHSSSVVLALQSRLASMSAHFKQVLEVRSENLKHQNSRRERFAEGLPPLRGSSMLLDDESVQIEVDGAGRDVGGTHRVQRTILRDETDDYVAQRAETVHNIESTIVELGGIFQQLAHMVKEQDEAVTRIDTNIHDAELNIHAAHSQILKYFQSVTGNRMLMFKIFGVLIFFFLFFVIFLS